MNLNLYIYFIMIINFYSTFHLVRNVLLSRETSSRGSRVNSFSGNDGHDNLL